MHQQRMKILNLCSTIAGFYMERCLCVCMCSSEGMISGVKIDASIFYKVVQYDSIFVMKKCSVLELNDFSSLPFLHF